MNEGKQMVDHVIHGNAHLGLVQRAILDLVEGLKNSLNTNDGGKLKVVVTLKGCCIYDTANDDRLYIEFTQI